MISCRFSAPRTTSNPETLPPRPRAWPRLTHKPLRVAVPDPAGGLQAEAFPWFPADTNFVAGMELWSRHATLAAARDPIRELIAESMRGREREELYQVADSLGNI